MQYYGGKDVAHHTKRYKIGKDRAVDVTRRTFLKGIGGLSLVMAAGTAPAFIREAGASKTS